MWYTYFVIRKNVSYRDLSPAIQLRPLQEEPLPRHYNTSVACSSLNARKIPHLVLRLYHNIRIFVNDKKI